MSFSWFKKSDEIPLSREIERFLAQHGNAWNLDVKSASKSFFESLHARRPIPPDLRCQKAIPYGSHPRQRLDVYWKPSEDKRKNQPSQPSLPVVVYFHGGGFRAGDNDITPHMHGNIARYFASNETVGVLATYRLLPDCQYPSGIEDVIATLTWIKANIGSYGGDSWKVFVIGQGAGGAHVAMALVSGAFHKDRGSSDMSIPRSIILQSVPFWYDLDQPRRRENMEAYYGTTDREQILSRSVLGLLENMADCGPHDHPDIFLTVGGYDTEEVSQGTLWFLQRYYKKVKLMPRYEVMTYHNHISHGLAIGLEGDTVGPMLLWWVRAYI